MKSIWDGWTKQCFDRPRYGEATCANGFLMNNDYSFKSLAIKAEVARVGRYIQKTMGIPATYTAKSGNMYFPTRTPIDAVVYANNVLRLTPDDFRRIDIESQIEEGMGDVEKLIESVKDESCSKALMLKA